MEGINPEKHFRLPSRLNITSSNICFLDDDSNLNRFVAGRNNTQLVLCDLSIYQNRKLNFEREHDFKNGLILEIKYHNKHLFVNVKVSSD